MSTIEVVRRTAIGAERWEPCTTSDGRTIGEAEWLRRRTDDGWSHTAMLWRCEPMTFDYEFPGDKSFVVITGAVSITLTESGETVELRKGRRCVIPKGHRVGTGRARTAGEVHRRIRLAPGVIALRRAGVTSVIRTGAHV